ncbi:MAG: 3'(2'),5'-bisphosphate nucleotidase CysQ [Myxococcales bacterium]|nr:3'(2'),5'-bisphosphate nucleotidase CysQ [Myxococcales bacterium]
MSKLTREILVAREAASLGAKIIDEIYAQDFAVDWKGADDPVTTADRAANQAIVALLRERFPDDSVCAEESGEDDNRAAVARGGRVWFVDPVDGTKEFIAKNGEFCVMVGLAIDGVATVGAVVAPAWKRALWGAVGEGAFESREGSSPTPLVVRAPSDAIRMVASRSRPDARVEHVARTLGIDRARPCGSVGLKVALVAACEADLYVLPSGGAKLWDSLAPHAIANAAGATVTDARGEAIRYAGVDLALGHGIVVAHPTVHARAIDALRSAS